MESHFFSFMGQWFMYFLPTTVAWVRLRMGKQIPLSLGQIFFFNLLLAWTVVVWFLLMANAFGYNPVPWLVFKLAKLLPASGPGPMGTPQTGESFSSQGQVCSNCGGSGSMTCSQCQGRGSWYTQPTSADDVAQLQTCSYCMSSGRIQCPYCGGAHG